MRQVRLRFVLRFLLVIIENVAFTKDDLIDTSFILRKYDPNPLLASTMYAERFPNKRYSQKNYFQRLLDRFKSTEHVYYHKKLNSHHGYKRNQFLVFVCECSWSKCYAGYWKINRRHRQQGVKAYKMWTQFSVSKKYIFKWKRYML